MKKTISLLTATRAEYGLLKPLIDRLNREDEFDVRVVVTGAHLSPEFDLTFREIEKDGIVVDEKIEMLLSADTTTSISKSMGLAMISFADYFERTKPDLLVVLGDRYETLAVCTVAMNQRIPVAHLYGGETTEGAIDESIRHAITKMSYLHFTSTSAYKQRVIQLGEHPERVFNVGALGVENIVTQQLLTKDELELSLGFKLTRPYALVTFHPVTLENNQSQEQFQELLRVVSNHKDIDFIFTKANADANGRIINKMIDSFVSENRNAVAYTSLGMIRYLSAMKYCSFVIGNSSSGLLETPSFKIPTINIGDRQKGRIQAESIINCEPNKFSMESAINRALSQEFIQLANNVNNPYGDGQTSKKVVDVIKEFILNNKINLKKKFFDLDVN
jgi:GDP/UDP-N,N'-diacetylbacillosamine 2-epimerase (hydrolysing)